jgi:multidrug transporter EmrE-like cation transporter
MNSMVALYLALACACNLGTVVFLKESKGMTVPWATFGVVISILATQWLMASVLSSGVQVGVAVTAVVVTVMIGGGIIGWIWYQEKLSSLEIVGYAIAVGGIIFANVSRVLTESVALAN